MFKQIKKVLSVSLAVLMVVSCLWSAFTVQAADVLFTDNFTSGTLSGWSSQTGTVSGGAYVLQGTASNAAASAGDVADVAIMADVSVNKAQNSDGKFYNTGTATLLFNATQDQTSRYEFGIGVSKTGMTYAGVYRVSGSNSDTLYRISTNVPGTAAGKIVEGTSYALRVVTEGSSFCCFINDQLFFEYTVEDLTQGYAGVSTWNAKGTFDNFKVQKADKRELQSIRLENTPAEITPAGMFDLDIIAVYNSPYGQRSISTDDTGVKITGLDGKTGKKTLTVSYGGKSAKFTTNVLPSKEGELILSDTFDTADNWNLGTSKMDSITTQAQITGGKLKFDMPSQPGFDRSFTISNSLKNASKLLQEPYYSIEVDVTIYGNSTSITPRPGRADIVYAQIDGAEHRFRVASDGRVYTIVAGVVKNNAPCDATLGKPFKMRIDVRGRSAQLYVNNKKVLSYSGSGNTVTPALQLRCVDGSLSYDNLKVTRLEEKSKWAVKAMNLVDANEQKVTDHKGYSFNPADYSMQLFYVDGTSEILSLTEDMLVGFDPSSKKEQKVKIFYGNHSANFTITYTDYLFGNDYSTGLMGMTASKIPEYTYSIRDGRLVTSFTIPKEARSVNQTFALPGVSTYTNYSVSTDVMLATGNAQRGIHGGVQLRRGGGTSYTYRLTYQGNEMNLYLYHNLGDGNGNVVLKRWNKAQLLSTFPKDALSPVVDLGVSYNLRIDAVDNALYCFFNGVLLDIVYDTNEKFVLKPGAVDLVAINASAMFDNTYVYPLDSRSISNIEIVGDNVKDGVLQVYQGFEVEPDVVSLKIQHTDGMTLDIPLWEKYIAQNYDPNVLGLQEMTVTYRDFSKKIKVNVVDRPDYVAGVVAKIKALKKGSLTAADIPAVKEMIRAFGTLSPYEVQNLGGSLYKDYVDLSTEADYLENEDLKGLEQIYYNDFSQTEDMANWVMVTDSGDTFSRNGYLVTEMQHLGIANSELMYQRNTYGEIASVEVDVMMTYPATFAALAVYSVEGNYYHLRITNKYVDENDQKVYTLQLYKYNGAQTKRAETYPLIRNVVVKEYEWLNLRMTLNGGRISCYANDVAMFQCDDSSSTDYITDGFVCFRSSENDVRYDNFKAYGVKKDIPKNDYIKQITPTEYTDDFEDEAVGTDPSHWVEGNETNDWKVMTKGGSKAYGTTVRSKPVYSWLHVFEIDPVYKAKFLTTAQSAGKVGFITRMFDETGYLAVGYNVALKKWFFASTMGVDMDTQVVYAEKATPLAAGTWHDIEITLKDAEIWVSVDGQEILRHNLVTCVSYGRIGVFANGADMYVDNVYVKSPNGASFTDGVLEYNIGDDRYLNTLAIEDMGNGTILGAHTENVFVSHNNGQTFTRVEQDDPLYAAKGDGYISFLKIGEGRYLKVLNSYANGNCMSVFESTDSMRTWTKVGDILPEDTEFVDALTGQVLPLQHTGSMTKVTMPNGVTRLFMPVAFRTINSANGGVLGHYSRFFYSDDYGRTWTESGQDTRDLIPDYNNAVNSTWAEGKIIACADGSIRWYQTRNTTGSVVYLESKDYGANWTEFGKIPYMQCPMGSFGIDEDPNAPGTYYMAFVHDTPYQLGNTFPRVRLTLVKTTDGKNWQFVTDVERATSWSAFNAANSYEVRQFLDPDVCVTEDYVLVTYGRSARVEMGQFHNAQRVRFVRFEKDKLTTRAWDDATMVDSCYPTAIEIQTLPQTKFGYGDLFNTAGMEIKVTAINGRVTTEEAKTYFLVDGEPNMFKLGKQTVRLMSKYYMFTEYEIEIVPNFNLLWTIKGKGTIDPNPDATVRMMEGASQTFTLKPAKGYKTSYVKINGEKVKIKKGTFTISDVHEDQEITVSFVKKTILDYLPWIILGVVVVAGITVGGIFLIPKLKKKLADKKAEKEDIDISSNSTPPTDEN